MSNWAKGSTSAWRRIRAGVLLRDKGLCQLKLEGCTTRATCVHHVLGRGVTGDDPGYLTSSCSSCNGKAGDPTKRSVQHKRISKW